MNSLLIFNRPAMCHCAPFLSRLFIDSVCTVGLFPSPVTQRRCGGGAALFFSGFVFRVLLARLEHPQFVAVIFVPDPVCVLRLPIHQGRQKNTERLIAGAGGRSFFLSEYW